MKLEGNASSNPPHRISHLEASLKRTKYMRSPRVWWIDPRHSRPLVHPSASLPPHRDHPQQATGVARDMGGVLPDFLFAADSVAAGENSRAFSWDWMK